jgi:prolyl 4-hydroxylase
MFIINLIIFIFHFNKIQNIKYKIYLQFIKMKNLYCILCLIGLLLLIISIVLIIIFVILPIFDKEHLTNSKINENNFYFIVDNFLTDEECDHIIDVSKDKLEKSKVMSVDKNNNTLDIEDPVRTSKQTWLNNNDYPKLIKKIENLVNKYTEENETLSVNKNQFEDIQVVRYEPNQEYKYHYDICHPEQCHKEHKASCKADYDKYKSIRYITVIFYLNDNFKGGETEFTKLRKKIKPKKGTALIFFNCNPSSNTQNDGLCDTIYNSEHAGTPVKSGEKWIANVWIRTKKI